MLNLRGIDDSSKKMSARTRFMFHWIRTVVEDYCRAQVLLIPMCECATSATIPEWGPKSWPEKIHTMELLQDNKIIWKRSVSSVRKTWFQELEVERKNMNISVLLFDQDLYRIFWWHTSIPDGNSTFIILTCNDLSPYCGIVDLGIGYMARKENFWPSTGVLPVASLHKERGYIWSTT